MKTISVLEHSGLCRVIAQRYRGLLVDPALSNEDLSQEAVIGVLQAANSRSFDPQKGSESTFVGTCVTNSLRRLAVRSNCKCRRGRPWSLDEVTHPRRGVEKSETVLGLMSRQEVDPADYAQYEEEYRRVLSQVERVVYLVRDVARSKQGQEAFLLRYGLFRPWVPTTLPVVAQLLGLRHRQRVQQLVNAVWKSIIDPLGLSDRQSAKVWLSDLLNRLVALREYLEAA